MEKKHLPGILFVWQASLMFGGFGKCSKAKTLYRYLPLGDSYTICTGATEQTDSWPLQY